MAAEPIDIPAAPFNAQRLITDGIRNHSTAELSRALQLDRSLLSTALFCAVCKGSVFLTEYLLTTERARVDALTPLAITVEPSIELLETVVSAGWDLNQRSPESREGKGPRLLDLVAGDEDLVKWCLEHGAQVSDGAEDEDTFGCPPITESVAALGTVSSFKLLRAHGARFGRRTLHRAAESAAICDKPERMAMLRFLVEEEGLDVNRTDTDGRKRSHWGTPIAYAAKGKGGEEAVRYLLSKGADPTKGCRDNHDAFGLADFYGNEDVLWVLRESIKGDEGF